MKAVPLYVSGVVSALIGIGAMVAGGCANDQQAKGHELYNHYCSHCHGESGRQNEGYNWSSMPDPKPGIQVRWANIIHIWEISLQQAQQDHTILWSVMLLER